MLQKTQLSIVIDKQLFLPLESLVKTHFAGQNLLHKKNFVALVLLITLIYRTRAIKCRGLYIFSTLFENHFFVFKEVF